MDTVLTDNKEEILPTVVADFLNKWHIPAWDNNELVGLTLGDIPDNPIPTGILLPNDILAKLAEVGFRCPNKQTLPEPVLLVKQAQCFPKLMELYLDIQPDDYVIQVVEPNGAFRFQVPQRNIYSHSVKFFDNEKVWRMCVNLLNEGLHIQVHELEAVC